MSKICLIDADGLLFLSLPRKEETNKTVEDCVKELKQRIKNICEVNNTDKYILFFTSSSNFRKRQWKYSKDYKGKRKNVKVSPIFKYLHEYSLQQLNAFLFHGLEADDLVSYFKNKIQDSVICSPDKDVLYQNEGIHYNYKTGEFISVDKEYSEEFIYKQLGQGDAGDDVAGIEGVGSKTIDKWFKNKKNLTYAQILIKAYIEKYGLHEGVNRFYESFSMIYLLRTDQDMLRELGTVPDEPIINILENEGESIY